MNSPLSLTVPAACLVAELNDPVLCVVPVPSSTAWTRRQEWQERLPLRTLLYQAWERVVIDIAGQTPNFTYKEEQREDKQARQLDLGT